MSAIGTSDAYIDDIFWPPIYPHPQAAAHSGEDAAHGDTRLCKALLDRITDRAHILETGTESYRFRRTMERKKKT